MVQLLARALTRPAVPLPTVAVGVFGLPSGLKGVARTVLRASAGDKVVKEFLDLVTGEGDRRRVETILPMVSAFSALLLGLDAPDISTAVAEKMDTNLAGAHALLAWPLAVVHPTTYERVVTSELRFLERRQAEPEEVMQPARFLPAWLKLLSPRHRRTLGRLELRIIAAANRARRRK